jgi:hypothetical protein
LSYGFPFIQLRALRQKIPPLFAPVAGAEIGNLPGLQEDYLFRRVSSQRFSAGGYRRKKDYLYRLRLVRVFAADAGYLRCRSFLYFSRAMDMGHFHERLRTVERQS